MPNVMDVSVRRVIGRRLEVNEAVELLRMIFRNVM